MSSEEIFSTRELPLFPLPVVLFPGALLPLHIFEERYKQMIKDCLDSDKMFGVSYHGERENWPPTLGRIGAIAQIMAVVPLDEGRMNILTIGGLRYRTSRYVGTDPYLKAEVELFQDDPDDQDTAPLVADVKQLYERASSALKELDEEQIPLGELPESPEEFSFAIAASLQLPLEKKQSLLELRSTPMRLKRLHQHLAGVIEQYEVRAQIHSRAKRNGHSNTAKNLINEVKDLSKEG